MILVTGATGQIGRRVARLLVDEGHAPRLMVRNLGKVPGLPGAEVVRADYAEPETLDSAFAGIETALLVSGYAAPGERARLHRNAIEAAARAGVGHVVYTSFQGASPESRFPMSRDHFETEGYLAQSGVAYTALRDSFYLDLIPDMFGEAGVMRGPAGRGRAAWVSRDDVARVAFAVLKNPSLGSGVFDLTGAEALTMEETAERMSSLAGRELRYEEETVEEGRAWRSRLGAPDWEVDTWLGSYEAIAAGELAATSDTIARITDRRPETLEEYFSAHPELLAPLGPRPI